MRMRALPYILALTAVPAFVAQAADDAGAMEGYFPTDGTIQAGAHVRLVLPEEFSAQMKKFSENLQKVSKEKREAYMKNFALDHQIEYDAEVWPDKADYDRFVEVWRQAKVDPISPAGVGLQKINDNMWRVVSAIAERNSKRQQPLSISALRYDAARNVWVSGNGELTARDYSTTEASIYGAQTGTEWSLEKEDSLTRFRETIRVTKTTDGKYVYLAYSFIEQSIATGTSIAQGAYLLQFPVQKAGANLGRPGQR